MSSGPFRANPSPIISAAELAACARDPDVRIVDARWYLSGKHGWDEYRAGHIPGAAFADLDRDLASPRGAGPGRHPLPSARAFAQLLSRLAITATTRVIAYDDAGGAIASRLWWLLRHYGLRNAAVLDGGIGAWCRAGGRLTTEIHTFTSAAPLTLVGRRDDIVDKQAVERLRHESGVLILDARAPERFEGKSEPIDARAGHIPGARSLPFAGNLTEPAGRFKDREELAMRYQTAGAIGGQLASTVVCYCGSGVTACHNLLALALVGRDDALLYEGSWSDWASDESLPAAQGPG